MMATPVAERLIQKIWIKNAKFAMVGKHFSVKYLDF